MAASRIIISLSLLFLATSTQTYAFTKNDVDIYPLKQLQSDLAQNRIWYDEKTRETCSQKGEWACTLTQNAYQSNEANDDLILRFIEALRSDNKKAADMINTLPDDKNNTNTLLPFVCLSCFSQILWAIPFHNWILGIQNEWNGDYGFKFFYLRIYKNYLIKIQMSWSLRFDNENMWPRTENTKNIQLLWMSANNKLINSITLPVSCKKDSNNATNIICNYIDAFRRNLFGLAPNTALDERKSAFQSAIKNIKVFAH